MLQTKVNHFRNLCKMALLIPTSVLFLVVFAEKSYAQEVEKQKEVSPLQTSTKYKIIKVQGVGLPNGKGEKTTVVLIDESGNEIVEQITNNEDRQAFTKKYGLQLPPPPPPPPSAIRVKKAEELPPPPAPPTPVRKMKKSTEVPPPPPPPVPVKEK